MKLPLVATRIGILSFKLLVAVIVALSILPLIMGGINVDFGTDNETDWQLNGDTLELNSPLTVSNNGVFAINDLTVGFTFLDKQGNVLSQSESERMDIPAGGDTELPIIMSLDLGDMDQEERSDFIFNGTNTKFLIDVDAKYTLGLVSISFKGGDEMNWEPLISGLDVMSESAYLREEGGEYFMVIPYTLNAQDMVQGQMVVVTTQFRDAQGFVGNVTQTVELGPYMWEEPSVPIPFETYDRLMLNSEEVSASVTLTFLDCSNSANDTWGWGY
ncbi:MAG: hypothetical protein NT131_07490 [Methanomassiliicoccales archaeon]|nr:hypothetical protein [Methanomassiliicoccales archaeon]